jgi:multiple sugar transport system ATP-binding protein
VATFIGSPAMNAVPVEPTSENGKALLRNGEFHVEVPPRFLDAAGSGRPLVVGLRPEHLAVANGASPDGAAARVPAQVDVVEYLGDEQLVHLHSGEVALVAKLPVEPRLAPQQDVSLTVPLEKLYLFDRESEQAIDVPF